MKPINEMKLQIESRSINESFARAAVSAFAAQLDPNIEELSDIKTAVSEAVTNCVVHAYPYDKGEVIINASIVDNCLTVTIKDDGIGIANFEQARMPFYTTKPEGERSGVGFAVMESFMDGLELSKNGDKGLCVTMKKFFKGEKHINIIGG
jgi:stage II sporulation protein AB (anti-sigma F factor)